MKQSATEKAKMTLELTDLGPTRAVEGSFRQQAQPIPAAEVRVVNDVAGVPTLLEWYEPANVDAEEGTFGGAS